jgi:RNA polymerase sigma-70 factor (ECF subfamily)
LLESNNGLISCLFCNEEISMTPTPAAFEDSTLIELTLAGRSECFAVLMDRHLASVKRCIGAMVRNGSDVDDLVQEVLLKVWRHLGSFRSEASFRTWMTRVAVNEVLQSYRRQRQRPVCQPLEEFNVFVAPGDSPYQSLARAETTKKVRSVVEKLPEKYRSVVVLREFEQLTTREAARSLQSSVPAVKSRLVRARVLLTAALKRPVSTQERAAA